jgi:hypothetical protein
MVADIELRPLKQSCNHQVPTAWAEFLTRADVAKADKWSDRDRAAVESHKFSLEAVRAFEGTRLWRQQIEAEIIDVGGPR